MATRSQSTREDVRYCMWNLHHIQLCHRVRLQRERMRITPVVGNCVWLQTAVVYTLLRTSVEGNWTKNGAPPASCIGSYFWQSRSCVESYVAGPYLNQLPHNQANAAYLRIRTIPFE